jgi:hypothetical protein
MRSLKRVVLFALMLALFALGLIVVGFSASGGVSWLEIGVVTVGFGIWWVWKRSKYAAQRNGPKKIDAA